MRLAAMIIFMAMALVYFIDFVVLFIKKDIRWWQSLLLSAFFAFIVIISAP